MGHFVVFALFFCGVVFGFDCGEWINSCSGRSNMTGSVLQCLVVEGGSSECFPLIYDRAIHELLEKDHVEGAIFVLQKFFGQFHPSSTDLSQLNGVTRLLEEHLKGFNVNNETALQAFFELPLWDSVEPLLRDEEDEKKVRVRVGLFSTSEWRLEAVIAPSMVSTSIDLTCIVPTSPKSPLPYAHTFRVVHYPPGLSSSLSHLADFLLRILSDVPLDRIYATDDMAVLALSELSSRSSSSLLLPPHIRNALMASMPYSSATMFPPALLSKLEWAQHAMHEQSETVKIPLFQSFQSCDDLSGAFERLNFGPLMMKSEYSFGSSFVIKVPSVDEGCLVAQGLSRGVSSSVAHAGHPALQTRTFVQQLVPKQAMHVVAVRAQEGIVKRGWTARVLHEYHGQGSVFQTQRNGAIEHFVERFIARVNYTGFCAFDFLEDFNGTFWMIDFNPRLIAMSCFAPKIASNAQVNICTFDEEEEGSVWKMKDGVIFANPLREPLRDCSSKYNAGWFWNSASDEPFISQWLFCLNDCDKK